MGKKVFSSCFISAPANINTSPIISLLKSKGICAYDSYSLGPGNLANSVEKDIASSHFLVAIFSRKSPSDNVLYEIGFARGAKKPVFLILQDEGAVPYFLRDNVYVRTELDNSDLISYYLDQFLSKHGEGIGQRPHYVEKPSPKKEILSIGKLLSGIRANGREIDFLNLVKSLFASQGYVVESSQGLDQRADMSIWVDSLDSTLGNPILVELKMGKLSEAFLKRSEEQLRNYLFKTNTRSGLLIYFDKQGRQFNPSQFKLPLVIRLEINDLIEKLVENSLDRVLLAERNRVAHGGQVG